MVDICGLWLNTGFELPIGSVCPSVRDARQNFDPYDSFDVRNYWFVMKFLAVGYLYYIDRVSCRVAPAD